ncbi:unnamed protein product [Ilex paraguariensis]|uniref:Putative plant transposon protein domain-containing protein n=1 Tax=Ilex paraguariensis TaxID=185542 RepID=A0ABC8R0C1_9AQUA
MFVKSERTTFGVVVMSGGEAKKRNKVVSGGSSEIAKLFMDKDAKKRYDSFIVKRPLLIERGVYLDELVGRVDSLEILRARKWEPLCDVNVDDKTYVELVKFFYANVHEYNENELTFKTLVMKKSITISPDLISNILKIDRPDILENFIVFLYSSKEQAPEMATVIQRICIGSVSWENEKSKIAHIDLTPTYRMINRIVACNIHLRGHIVEIGYDTAQLLYTIAEREVIIDLPHYIFNNVRETSTVEDGRPCLPFSILVSKILKHNGVEFQQNDIFIYPINPLDMGILNKSVGAILGVKRGKRVKQATAVPQVMGSQAGTSQVGSNAGISEG